MMNLNEVCANAKRAANEARTTGGRSGCGRVYITVTSEKLKLNTGLGKALLIAGFKVMARPYSKLKHIYIGYDNATGREWAQAEAAADVLKSAGISCYVDGDGD